ncbi:cyclic di-GMP phosphodiesterase Gmr [mine drainage metagenome]|uniref:Cyclic di-GMP phosphodiesterase Gmr n=1 Tax=mine drainage metagenome TaxID=410659 RepID=A0A1J5RZ48_9ZZZZ
MLVSWDYPLVLLSVLIAVVGSFTALIQAECMRKSNRRIAKVWMIAGSATLGSTIWAMHFIGMLAFRLPISIGYDVSLTILSGLPAFSAALLSFFVLSKPHIHIRTIFITSILMGAGICLMHYMGMAAIKMSPPISYNLLSVLASAIIAIFASMGALLMMYRGGKIKMQPMLRLALGGLIMGLAISSMHYTSMLGMQIMPGSVCLSRLTGARQETLAVAIALIVFLWFLGGVIFAMLSQRIEKEKISFYHKVIDAIPDAMLISDACGIITMANTQVQKVTGYKIKELNGQALKILVPRRFDGGGHVLVDQFRVGIVPPLKSAECETVILNKNGCEVDVEINVVPMQTRHGLLMLSSLRDISARKAHTVALQTSEAKLSAMFQTINDLVWLKDLDGVYLACNSAFERFFGAKEVDIVGKTDYDFVDKELANFFREHDRLAMGNGSPSVNEEWVTYADNGYRALLETTKTPMRDPAGRLIGVLGIAHDITERKLWEKTLKENEEQFHMVLNISQDGFTVHDLQTRYVEVNDAYCHMLGYSREELLQMTTFDVTLKGPLEIIEHAKKVVETGSDLYETSVRCKDGRILDISVNVIYSKQYKDRFYAFTRDITVHKQYEARIERLKKLYQALSEVNQAIVHMEHQSELFPLVCRCAVEFGGMQTAWISELDASSGLLVQVAKYGINLELVDNIVISTHADIPEGIGPGGTAMRENRSIIVNDIANLKTVHWDKMLSYGYWNAVAAFPICRDGQPFALLCVCHAQVNAFDDEAVALLTEMSVDIAFAIDNFDREEKRKQAEEANQLAASVYQTSSEAMVITDANRQIIDVNPAFIEVTGYSKKEVLGRNSNILRSPKHNQAVYERMKSETAVTGKWQGEMWAQRKNGEVFPMWLITNTVYNDDGSARYRISLFTDITEKKASEELIWQQAHIDSLTGLPNRSMFHDRFKQEINKSHRTGVPLALLYLDLDRFKEVNDTLGHDVGDLLLKETAQRLSMCVRDVDVVSRLGGDEFTIILTEVGDMTGIERVTESILESLSKSFQLGDDIVYVSTSIGITLYPIDATEPEVLLKNADQAMYVAKSAGRNQSSYFAKAMQDVAQKRMRLANDLRVALRNEQIWVAYQPIVDLNTGAIIKAEALARWQHPTLGSISPAEFIPIAESAGLIFEVGDWIFQQALLQVKHWQATYNAEFQVSVNKSPIQIQYTSSKTEPWHVQISKLGLTGKSIVAEITEGLLLDANFSTQEMLLEFRDAGIQVALDDFGTGYSSLSYLQKFDIDYIKIDQSFVRNLSPTSGDMALCEAIIVMAHKLGMKVIAEGIETTDQRYLLTLAGCDYGQGYLFSKPVPASEFEKLLVKV